MTADIAVKARERVSLVALLAWVYRDQKADIMTGKGLFGPEVAAVAGDEDGWEHHGWSRCGCAQMEAIGHVGCRIDGGGWQRPALHADAEAIHELVVALSLTNWMGAMLLRRYGRIGETPDWCGDVRQDFEPVYRGETSRKPVDDRFDEVSVVKGRVVKHLYCPIQLYPSNEWFELARGEYGVWYRGLSDLLDAMTGTDLRRFVVTGLGVPREPWRDGP